MTKYKLVVIHVLGWFTFVLFICMLFFMQNGFIPAPIFLNIALGILLFYLNYLVLVPSYLLRRKVILYVILSIASLIGTSGLLMVFKSVLFFRLRAIPSNFVIEFFLYAVMFLMGIALRIYVYWLENEKNKEAAASRQIAFELQNLKNQLNPHFLFNSLNSIYSLSLKKSDKSSEAIIMLSELMRYMLYETNEEFVSLQKEIDYIKNYFALQKLQIADTKNVDLIVQGNITTERIRPLLLISFIENAFKFGTDYSGKTYIKVMVHLHKNVLSFNCENSMGSQTGLSGKNSGIGLQNTIERLKLSYPGKHSLNVSKDQGVYKVALSLQLL